MIYLYAITTARGRPGPLPRQGLDGAPVRVVDHAGLAAVVSDRDDATLVADTDALWAHERVVEAVMDEATVLPVRFGTQFSSEGDLLGVLDQRCDALSEALARLVGKVELGVRALWPGEPDHQRERPESGTGYMMAKLEGMRREADRRHRAAGVATALDEPLARLSHASNRRVMVTDRLVLSGAYLVGEDRVAEFRDMVADLQSAHPHLEVLCTGPWPPYSFVEPSPPSHDEDAPDG